MSLRDGVITGAVAAVLCLVASRTALLFAYGPGGALSPSQAQAVCDSARGQFARALSTAAAAKCGAVDSQMMWLNIGLYGGLLLAVCCAAALGWRRRGGQVLRPPNGV